MRMDWLLPHYLIIGVVKGGTTSLYSYLTQHPFIEPARQKEINFFNGNYDKGLSWYQSHFPLFSIAAERSLDKQNYITGEASPEYMIDTDTPKRVYQVMPNVKLIVLLRNPVDRAYSHFNHRVRWGETSATSFEQELEQKKYPFFYGVYHEQLNRWMSVFPKSQMLVLRSEDLYENPEKITQQCFRFLGVETVKIGNFEPQNQGDYRAMNPNTRECLVRYFRPHNQILYELVGRDFGWDD